MCSPAFLIGRPGGRILETIGVGLVPVLNWFAPGKVAVDISEVAKAMSHVAISAKQTETVKGKVLGKARIFENKDILELARD